MHAKKANISRRAISVSFRIALVDQCGDAPGDLRVRPIGGDREAVGGDLIRDRCRASRIEGSQLVFEAGLVCTYERGKHDSCSALGVRPDLAAVAPAGTRLVPACIAHDGERAPMWYSEGQGVVKPG